MRHECGTGMGRGTSVGRVWDKARVWDGYGTHSLSSCTPPGRLAKDVHMRVWRRVGCYIDTGGRVDVTVRAGGQAQLQ
eukprot:360243-Chlamydomonas_euryale.AAC.5